MAIAMKGIFRGLKIIAQIFTMHRGEHEIEIEIGYPTDVRHVSHVGLGASDDSCPSWMSAFRGVEEVTAGRRGASIVGSATESRHTSWASLDFEPPATGAAPPIEACADSSSSGQDGAARGGGGAPVTTKKAARPRKSSRAPAPASPGGSSSCRSTASFATACGGHSGELHAPAGLQDT